MKEEKVIMYNSPEAATYRTNIEGWVNSEGRFWGKDEHMARWSGCTHKACACGKQMSKHYTKCEGCRNRANMERYNALPEKEYDGEYLYSHVADKYFFSEDELLEYCEDEEVKPEDLRLVFCEPNYLGTLELNCDEFPEDAVSKEVLSKLDELNRLIQAHKPISYSPGKIRASFNNYLKQSIV